MNSIDLNIPHNGNPLYITIGDRVFEFRLSDDWTKCHVSEMCDQCFGETFDKNGIDLLINYLSILKSNMQ